MTRFTYAYDPQSRAYHLMQDGEWLDLSSDGYDCAADAAAACEMMEGECE